MELAVNILKLELADALDSGEEGELVADLRQAIMVLNKNLFHQKIMGADPNNKYYAA
jgi:hypothetical protein